METATFAAGCFWGVEEVFRQTPGVSKTVVGYSGGSKPNPTYEDVCTGRTGHAEAVQIEFEPKKVSYEKLLEIFFENHDPTTLNRDGPNIGTEYRSVIFYHDKEQEQAARKLKEKLEKNKRFKRPIVTAIEPASTFWPAEEYHQQFLAKRGLSSCHF